MGCGISNNAELVRNNQSQIITRLEKSIRLSADKQWFNGSCKAQNRKRDEGPSVMRHYRVDLTLRSC